MPGIETSSSIEIDGIKYTISDETLGTSYRSIVKKITDSKGDEFAIKITASDSNDFSDNNEIEALKRLGICVGFYAENKKTVLLEWDTNKEICFEWLRYIVMPLFKNTKEINIHTVSSSAQRAINIIEALSHLHKVGILPNDLHGENFLTDPETGKVTIIDFESCYLLPNDKSSAVVENNYNTELDLSFYKSVLAPENFSDSSINPDPKRYAIASVAANIWSFAFKLDALGFSEIAQRMQRADPIKRPSLDQIREELQIFVNPDLLQFSNTSVPKTEDKALIMRTLIDISNRSISKVRASMIIGPSNQTTNIERTAGWAASADAVNFDLLAEEMQLTSLYKHKSFEDGIFAVKDAVSAAIAKAGNCGYMTALALKFIAEDPKFIGMTVKRKYFREPFQHTFLELCYDESIVYCDPWLELTFDGSQNSIAIIAQLLIKIENEHLDRLASILKNSKFENFSLFEIDIDTESVDQDTLTEIEHNFVSYCYKNIDWAHSQASQALERQEEEVKNLKNFIKNLTSPSLYLQNNDDTDSYNFTLSDTNKDDFLSLFELLYLLELQTSYPNSFELYTQICRTFEQTKHLQADGEYANKSVQQFLKWQREGKPSTAKPMIPLLNELRLRQQQSFTSITPIIKEYCGLQRGFIPS